MLETCTQCKGTYNHTSHIRHVLLMKPRVCSPKCFLKLIQKPTPFTVKKLLATEPRFKMNKRDMRITQRSNLEVVLQNWLREKDIPFQYELLRYSDEVKIYVPDVVVFKGNKITCIIEAKGYWADGYSIHKTKECHGLLAQLEIPLYVMDVPTIRRLCK